MEILSCSIAKSYYTKTNTNYYSRSLLLCAVAFFLSLAVFLLGTKNIIQGYTKQLAFASSSNQDSVVNPTSQHPPVVLDDVEAILVTLVGIVAVSVVSLLSDSSFLSPSSIKPPTFTPFNETAFHFLTSNDHASSTAAFFVQRVQPIVAIALLPIQTVRHALPILANHLPIRHNQNTASPLSTELNSLILAAPFSPPSLDDAALNDDDGVVSQPRATPEDAGEDAGWIPLYTIASTPLKHKPRLEGSPISSPQRLEKPRFVKLMANKSRIHSPENVKNTGCP